MYRHNIVNLDEIHPQVGFGATLIYRNETFAGTIVYVSETGHTLKWRQDTSILFQPRPTSKYGMTFEQNPTAEERKFVKGPDGLWRDVRRIHDGQLIPGVRLQQRTFQLPQEVIQEIG